MPTPKREPIVTVIGDDHTLHCMTEGHLDVWWRSLTPDRKVVLFEAELEGLLDLNAFSLTVPAGPDLEQRIAEFTADMTAILNQPLTPLAGTEVAR